VGQPSEPGFACVSIAHGLRAPDLAAALRLLAPDASVIECSSGTFLATWGAESLTGAGPLLLTSEVRRRDEELTPDQVARHLVGGDGEALAQLLPTFGAVALAGDATVVACTDALGFRQLFWRRHADWAAVSTSSRFLAALHEPALDLDAVAVQGLLGWQLGLRTLFRDVEKVPAAGRVTVRHGVARLDSFRQEPEGPTTLAAAVPRARDLLRGYLDAYLDDHPDPVLQLTGGQDSRLLLSAITPARRRGLRVMTLGVPGSTDVAIAADLARRYGLRHEVLRLRTEPISPADAYAACAETAGRLELVADPVARAALDEAEAAAEPGPRLSGLGGEVARGFYYLGRRGMDAPVTRTRVRRLVDWRMFANESVPLTAFGPDVVAPRESATEDVFRLMSESGEPWFAATDRFYLEQRMQRWAGATETAMCTRLEVANPMLDDRFIAIANALDPADKQQSRFLASLQVALDIELSALPLDERPAPRAYAAPGLAGRVAQSRATATRAGRKLGQRLRGDRRPPAGGALVAGAVVEHWREHPELLEPVAASGALDPDWVAEIANGSTVPDPAGVAFLVNLSQAVEVVRTPVVPNLR
jgi:asparagine synthase (glutamine-hydrolysing)